MTLDATPDHPPHGTVRDIEHDPREKPRQPGEYRLRIVTTLMIIAAALTTWQFLGALFSGTIDIGGLVMAPLAICSAVGLYKRSDSGRKAGIIFLWISLVISAIAVTWLTLAWNAIILILIAVTALGVATGTFDEPERGSFVWSTGYMVVLLAIGIWVLTVLHSSKTIALMETSTPPASDEQEDLARASEHA